MHFMITSNEENNFLRKSPTGVISDKGTMLQYAMGEELRSFFGRTLMPSVLDKVYKGEL